MTAGLWRYVMPSSDTNANAVRRSDVEPKTRGTTRGAMNRLTQVANGRPDIALVKVVNSLSV